MVEHIFEVGETVQYKGGWVDQPGALARVVRLFETPHVDGVSWATFQFDHGRLTTRETDFEKVAEQNKNV